MQIGYMRISKGEQPPRTRQDALTKALVERTYRDVMSGVRDDRPQFQAMIDFARPGDTIVVWRLDRLGRSIRDLIAWVSWLEQEGIGLQSLQEAINTTSPSGRLTFHLFAALAEFERQLIQERTQAGLSAARARGRRGGRPKSLAAEKRKRAVQLYQAKQLPVKEICAMMGISKPTLYAYVREASSPL